MFLYYIKPDILAERGKDINIDYYISMLNSIDKTYANEASKIRENPVYVDKTHLENTIKILCAHIFVNTCFYFLKKEFKSKKIPDWKYYDAWWIHEYLWGIDIVNDTKLFCIYFELSKDYNVNMIDVNKCLDLPITIYASLNGYEKFREKNIPLRNLNVKWIISHLEV